MLRKNLRLLAIAFSEEDEKFLYSEITNIHVYKSINNLSDMRSAVWGSDWDVILFNHDKSFLDYCTVLNVLKESGKDIPFIIYSDVSDEDTVLSALYSGVHDYVHKGNAFYLIHAIEREIRNAGIRQTKAKADDQISYLAFHDGLTNLPNCSLFSDKASAMLSRLVESDAIAAMYLVDFDRLPYINSIYGSSVGDRLIQQFSQRLSAFSNENCLLTRIEGCKFAFINANVIDAESVQDFANRIIKLAISPVAIDNLVFYLRLNIGICVYPANGENIARLLANAESTLSNTRYLWKNTCTYYTKEIEVAAIKRSVLEISLRSAIEKNELLLHYQPIVDLQSGALSGVEALVRWNHPEFGLLLPEKFIPLAQEIGLIIDIGRWVLQQACRQAKLWHQTGYGSLSISVNISAIEFDQIELVNSISQVLAETGISSGLLELEISESTLMRDAETSTQILQALKDMNIKIAMDNFGTGYSSLRYLKHFSIDILKIDRSLTHDIIIDPDSSEIIAAIIAMAKNLDLSVLATGIETKEQFDFLHHLRCDRAQGFLFSKPMIAQDMLHLLTQRKTGTLA
ncbi:EAL domain-containing protein [Nitrosomonas sp.]|uniref:GGDEF/EAL domain-containing response regulator n=1 Tax=Nitrosomonas sp. TaxID=42353 RepID=UPI002736E0B9|nr:EAL domain-containing protein [Nitrosomonas sp.]